MDTEILNLALPYAQQENDLDALSEIKMNSSMHPIEKLKQLFVFVTPNITADDGSYMWLCEPVTIQTYTEKIGRIPFFKKEVSGYHVYTKGFTLQPDSVTTDPSDNAVSLKVRTQRLIDTLPAIDYPLRTDRNEAIVEANDINYLVNAVKQSIDVAEIYNLSDLEVWSVYDVFKYIGAITPEHPKAL